jgi:hypothetical protein
MGHFLSYGPLRPVSCETRYRMASRPVPAAGFWCTLVALLVCGAVVCSPQTGDKEELSQAASEPASSGVAVGRFRPTTPLELRGASDSVDVPIRLVELVYPVFPSEAPCAVARGRVLVGVVVGADSTPTRFGVAQTDLPPECRDYVLTHLMDVVRQSTFWPALKSGSPVAATGVFPVSFSGAPPDTGTASEVAKGAPPDTARD